MRTASYTLPDGRVIRVGAERFMARPRDRPADSYAWLPVQPPHLHLSACVGGCLLPCASSVLQ